MDNNINQGSRKNTDLFAPATGTGYLRSGLRRRRRLEGLEVPVDQLRLGSSRGAVRSAQKLPKPSRGLLKEGRVNLNPRGFAFVTTEDGEAYFIKAPLARMLLTGDQIRFYPEDASSQGADDSQSVRSISHVERAASMLLCEVHLVADLFCLAADEPCFLPLQLSDWDGCQAGDVVAVAVPGYSGSPAGRPLVVQRLKNLGPRTREGFDLDYVRTRYGFDVDFPAELQVEAQAISELPHKVTPHMDLRDVPFVTIDGDSTRDFDDAVQAEALPRGGWRIRVAISDVSWHVRPGSRLDAWAAQRCTSLYLPGQMVPMLPEVLSISACSLLPGVERFAVVMTLHLSETGELLEKSVVRARVVSAARLTYAEVASFMAGEASLPVSSRVKDSLTQLTKVYAVLTALRSQAGRLEFEEPEPHMVQDSDGHWKLAWESRTEAHKLVEELMLLANGVAASMLIERYGVGLMRHQPPPDAEAWELLRTWAQAKTAGELPETPSLRAMAELVAAQMPGDAQMAAVMKVRSTMRPAKYVVHDKSDAGGHFSLSMPWYTHFTSPIRRYADLLVHRLLLAPPCHALDKGSESLAELIAAVARCSERAQAAKLAERMIWDRLKLQGFLADTTPADSVRARVVRANQRGARVVITGWQCSAWLPGGSLRQAGYNWVDEAWVSAQPDAKTPLIQDGTLVSVKWVSVVNDRPAYPELQVTLD